MTREQLLRDVSTSRAEVSRTYASVRTEMDVAQKINTSVRRKPLAWLGGAAALGWMLAGPKTRTKVVTKTGLPGKPGEAVQKTAARAGIWPLLFSLVRLLFPLAKPFIAEFAGKGIASVANRFAK